MSVSRRAFLSASAAAASGALVIGFRLHGPWHAAKLERTPIVKRDEAAVTSPGKTADPFDAWIHIRDNGAAVVVLEKCEMGQGIFTGLPMILADEAELDWKTVSIEQSLESTGTGGSGSTESGYLPLRKAGAVVREAMIGAAAHLWNISRQRCFAREAKVFDEVSGRAFSYGELVRTARALPLPDPDHVRLKAPSEFRLIGHAIPARDIPDKVMATARFGLDTHLPGMVYAVVARCPVFGGTVAHYDAGKTLAVPGVLKVFKIAPRGFQIYCAGGVVVVATTTWAAMQGRKALTIDWNFGPHRGESSRNLSAELKRAAAGSGKVVRREGDPETALRSAAHKIAAAYEFPFLAHATMEPMNTTIHLQDVRCEVWCPSQSPDWARSAIAKELGFQEKQVVVHTTFMGGGFGRRFIGDYPTEAAQIARHIDGPVQLVWSREDDMTHDFYRPASAHQLEGALDPEGHIAAWRHHIASTSIRVQWDPPEKVKPEAAEIGSAVDPPYPLPVFELSYTPVASAVPRGWWRSVENSFNVFAVECFVDELAFAAKQDSYLFRRRLLQQTPMQQTPQKDEASRKRLLCVLDLAARKADWGAPLGKNRGRGIACCAVYGYVAQVAEVTVRGGAIRVDRVVCAVDCGQAVNPNGVRQQIEGGVVFALSAILKGEITLAQGKIEQTNFDAYDLIRMPECPRIDVFLVENHLDPSGIGEAGVPCVGPAVANAIFAATGKRLRKLPLRLAESSA